jgi:hypothetical protein
MNSGQQSVVLLPAFNHPLQVSACCGYCHQFSTRCHAHQLIHGVLHYRDTVPGSPAPRWDLVSLLHELPAAYKDKKSKSSADDECEELGSPGPGETDVRVRRP